MACEPGIAEGNNPEGLAWEEAVVKVARGDLGKEPLGTGDFGTGSLAWAVAYLAYRTSAVEERSWRGTGAPSAGQELALHLRLEQRSWCP